VNASLQSSLLDYEFRKFAVVNPEEPIAGMFLSIYPYKSAEINRCE